jgi:hypothetical protein
MLDDSRNCEYRILDKLRGGDLRSIGKSKEVVADILNNPKLFRHIFEGITNNKDSVMRARAADVIEKVSRIHHEYLQPFKNKLINEIAVIQQQEVRWHVAQMFSYIEVTPAERAKIEQILLSWVDRKDVESVIVKVSSMQTLSNFAKLDPLLKMKILEKLKYFVQHGSPALKSRSKKLIIELG